MSAIRYLDTWERAQAQLIRLIALGLDALVDQATPLGEEEYRVALEDGARHKTRAADRRRLIAGKKIC